MDQSDRRAELRGVTTQQNERWAEERRIKESKLQSLIRDTALRLGKPWEYQEPSGYMWVGRIANGSAMIQFRVSGPDGSRRIAVSGVYPGNYLPWGIDTPSITVAMNRGAEVLAKEIRRRFLSKYLTLFDLNTKKGREDEERAQAQQETQDALLNLLSGTLSSAGRVIYFGGPGESRGTAEVYGGGSVEIKLRGLSYADACLLAGVLAKELKNWRK